MLNASIVGSSWNSADSSGVAPIRSPADTNTRVRVRCPQVVGRASTGTRRRPPGSRSARRIDVRHRGAGSMSVRAPMRLPELAVAANASSWPWKSFRPRIWIGSVVWRLGCRSRRDRAVTTSSQPQGLAPICRAQAAGSDDVESRRDSLLLAPYMAGVGARTAADTGALGMPGMSVRSCPIWPRNFG